MDITKLAPWIVALVNAQQDIDRGSMNCSILKNNGEVVGLRIENNRVINFSKGNNREAMVVVADILNGLDEKTCEFKLTFDVRKGKVRKLIISGEEQKKIDDN